MRRLSPLYEKSRAFRDRVAEGRLHMSTVVLIRAGCTDYDEQHRLIGTLDMPVNQKGQEQIREAIRFLRNQKINPQAIYTSPDDPASGTAHAIGQAFPSAKVRELDELRNVNQGLWQGLTESDVVKRFPRLFRNSRDSGVTICPPEGETLLDACARLSRALAKAIRKHDVLAVVACEPLATVIRCTLQQRQPRGTACLCGEEKTEGIQIIESSAFDATHFLNGETLMVMDPVTTPAGAQENGQ